jgi:hypothetical protein
MLMLLIPILLWLTIQATNCNGKCDIKWGHRGGGGKASAPPAPPSPGETAKAAINAQIDATPRILETQREYGSQFQQLDLEALQEFGPQFAEEGMKLQEEFGPRLAQTSKNEQDILDPSRRAGSEQVTEFLDKGFQGVSDEENRVIEQNFRGAQSARGFGESGMGSVQEIAAKFGARQALQSQFLNVGLAAAGRLPGTASGTIQPAGQAQGSQLVKNIDPTSIFGAQASNNTFASNAFSTTAQQATARRGQNFSLLG